MVLHLLQKKKKFSSKSRQKWQQRRGGISIARRYEKEYQQELEELDQMKRDGEISLETWELTRDNLDLNYPEEDPEYMPDLSDYPETFD